MRGTGQRSFQEIYDALESAGATPGLWRPDVHNTRFGGRALAEDLPLLLGPAHRSAAASRLSPPIRRERLRAQLLTGLAIRAEDTAEMASMAFEQIIYAGHPYRRPEDGYPETIQAITRQDMVEFHQRHYGPRHMVVVVVGAIHPKRPSSR